jgi:indolepyruvate ferredoxin oxidoreductase
MFMLGLAWQAGAIPLSHFAILKAIALNGVDVAMNEAAFTWGRRAALEPESVAEIARRRSGKAKPAEPQTIEELVARRTRFLTEYQSSAYAARYADMVRRIREAEARSAPGRADLAEAVARNLFKLMAVKDEYEVARLYTDGTFRRQLAAEFDGYRKLEFHLAPPLLGKRDPATGKPVKSSFGPWVMRLFRMLARFRRLRGTLLDPFGHTAERRVERLLRAEYEKTLRLILDGLTPDNHRLAVALAQYPEKIRGFGHVKAEAARRARAEAAIRREAFISGEARPEAAE